LAGHPYLAGMAKAFEFAIPTPGKAVPDGPQWIHEIKFDGFRMRLVREAERVKLFTRNGADWTGRYPWIVEAARRLRAQRFVLDGEAVVLDVRAYSDFVALVSRKHDDEVQLYAFDMLALEGDDLTKLPLSLRKTNLQRVLARRVDGIQLAPFEPGEIGPDLFRQACAHASRALSPSSLSGRTAAAAAHIGSKRKRNHPAFGRVQDQF
jgi:bifunctional non-homologous end joining protein LigD